MFSVLTFNAALLDIRVMNYPLHSPVPDAELRLQHIIEELESLAADVVILQEVFHYRHQLRIAMELAHQYPYTAGMAPRPFFRLGTEFLVLSRFPATDGRHVRFNQAAREERIFTSKGFYHCRINLPGAGEIDCINFHTTAGGIHAHPEHDSMEKIRADQVNQILDYAASLEMVLLAGDLNAGPHTSQQNYNQVLDSGFVDTFPGINVEVYTWDPENPLVASGIEHHLPAQRIDHIFMNTRLAEKIQPQSSCVVLKQKIRGKSGASIALSDHYGLITQYGLRRSPASASR